jgi:amino acid transporter
MREAAAPERQMKRSLGAFDLTCIGIGAIIGSGIFAMTGTAAAGQTFSSRLETPVLNFIQAWCSGGEVVLGRAGAGPAIAVSFIIAAIACGFAALCYAELASMIPVSGSAYTYSYATLGEIVAWTIGWDLILEYAVGNMSVAVGWSGYFVQLCSSLAGLKFPIWLVNDHATATTLIANHSDALANFSSTTLPVIAGHTIAFNLPALLIVVAVTVAVAGPATAGISLITNAQGPKFTNTITIDRSNLSPYVDADTYGNGDLTIYEPGNNGLAMTEIDGQRSYSSKASRFQRLLLIHSSPLVSHQPALRPRS